MQRVGGFLDVVGVHDQRFRHLARRAGEAAEDQRALLVVAGGDELLAHQVHAVVQAGHHADVAGAEELGDGVVLVVLGEQVNRKIVRPPEAGVDPLGDAGDSLLERLVLLEQAARRCRDLHEDEAADPFRALLEQPLEGVQALEDALGVVEPVDAEGEAGAGGKRQPLEDLAPALRHRWPGGTLILRWPFDRDRIALDQRLVALEGDDRMLMLDPRLEEAIDGLDEVLAVKAGVEAEDRAAEHALEDFPPPGTDAEGLGVRPGDVPEGQDGRPGQAGANHRRQQREVVVLHQDDRILAAGLGDDGIGEALVDGPVVLPVGFPEHRAHMGDMTQRPHAFVGEAVVVAPLLLGAEPDAPQDVFVAPGRHADPVVPVDDRRGRRCRCRARSRCPSRRASPARPPSPVRWRAAGRRSPSGPCSWM